MKGAAEGVAVEGAAAFHAYGGIKEAWAYTLDGGRSFSMLSDAVVAGFPTTGGTVTGSAPRLGRNVYAASHSSHLQAAQGCCRSQQSLAFLHGSQLRRFLIRANVEVFTRHESHAALRWVRQTSIYSSLCFGSVRSLRSPRDITYVSSRIQAPSNIGKFQRHENGGPRRASSPHHRVAQELLYGITTLSPH